MTTKKFDPTPENLNYLADMIREKIFEHDHSNMRNMKFEEYSQIKKTELTFDTIAIMVSNNSHADQNHLYVAGNIKRHYEVNQKTFFKEALGMKEHHARIVQQILRDEGYVTIGCSIITASVAPKSTSELRAPHAECVLHDYAVVKDIKKATIGISGKSPCVRCEDVLLNNDFTHYVYEKEGHQNQKPRNFLDPEDIVAKESATANSYRTSRKVEFNDFIEQDLQLCVGEFFQTCEFNVEKAEAIKDAKARNDATALMKAKALRDDALHHRRKCNKAEFEEMFDDDSSIGLDYMLENIDAMNKKNKHDEARVLQERNRRLQKSGKTLDHCNEVLELQERIAERNLDRNANARAQESGGNLQMAGDFTRLQEKKADRVQLQTHNARTQESGDNLKMVGEFFEHQENTETKQPNKFFEPPSKLDLAADCGSSALKTATDALDALNAKDTPTAIHCATKAVVNGANTVEKVRNHLKAVSTGHDNIPIGKLGTTIGAGQAVLGTVNGGIAVYNTVQNPTLENTLRAGCEVTRSALQIRNANKIITKKVVSGTAAKLAPVLDVASLAIDTISTCNDKDLEVTEKADFILSDVITTATPLLLGPVGLILSIPASMGNTMVKDAIKNEKHRIEQGEAAAKENVKKYFGRDRRR